MIAQRTIPRAGLSISEIGFGAASLGNLYRPLADAEARLVLEAALAAGMTYVDTAPHYGHGLSERRTGDVLRDREDIILSSKVGRLFRPNPALRGDSERHGFRSPMPFERIYDYSHDGVLRSYEDSLQRLGIARIDLLYVHDIGRLTHGAEHDHHFGQLTRGGGFRALERLRAEGAIAGFGLGVNEWQICLEAMDHADLEVVLLAGRYTLLEQTALGSFLPACLDRRVSVVIGGAYNSGILATGTRRGGPLYFDYGEAPPPIVNRVRRIEALCDEYGVPLAAAALQFPLAHPAVVSVVLGLGNAGRVEQTMALYGTAIPSDLWASLRAEHLIDAAAPLPAA